MSSKPPLAGPSASCVEVTAEISMQPPLSWRGAGPGLILVVAADLDLSHHGKTLDPPPLQKWAEEGYAVAQIRVDDHASALPGQLAVALAELAKLPECSSVDKVGLVVIHRKVSESLIEAVQAHPEIVAAVFYGCSPNVEVPVPVLCHLARNSHGIHEPVLRKEGHAVHTYPGSRDMFSIPTHADYRSGSAAVAHTRSLAFLKPLMNGPYFDLEAIWDDHTHHEFADRSVEETMATMVAEPYVNHVPTLTGGIGRQSLTGFYRDHFIFSNSDDAALELISRTVGVDRIVDEFLFNCTHDRVIDWLIPGIPPTFLPLSIPFTAIVNIRGDRLYHEHIAWDQGTVLRQLGLLPEYLLFPYPISGIAGGDGSKQFEFHVPVAGVQTAHKLRDENAVPSNEMLEFSVRELKDKVQ
ncbi:hypothetical protein B0T26DRAFT_706741 [Lasiosphaeria miniovina]|uniref:Carboxymethylenebutenolidase n=1 Tax=Lasiosphaeria miniovina TaxID=1954250 RepID=A0AA40AWZ2_9PEZI|nr:uncharacterized protein B0T26DRAFT_706741 [Lasiosphaeria miniovina]KAK0723539.1 hypothetical protein B0T26DRAFT_706741 [Lasiosphaeria miniovina]